MAALTTIRGNLTADRTVFFVHGWPDDASLFDSFYPNLEKDFRIVTLTLPGFGPDDGLPRHGLDFMTVVDRIIEAVDRSGGAKPYSKPPYLVAHDWGASLCTEAIMQRPGIFGKCVFLDIGCHVGALSPKAALLTLAYQGALIVAYFLPNILGTMLSWLVAWALGAPAKSRANISAKKNYLYLQLWKRIFTNRLPLSMSHFFAPPVPVLFLFGKKKPFMFHSEQWLQHLASATDGSAWKGYNGAHWFFLTPALVDEVNRDIRRFFG